MKKKIVIDRKKLHNRMQKIYIYIAMYNIYTKYTAKS